MSRRPAAALIALICKTITEEEKFETKDSSTRGTRQKPVEILQCHAKQSRENSTLTFASQSDDGQAKTLTVE